LADGPSESLTCECEAHLIDVKVKKQMPIEVTADKLRSLSLTIGVVSVVLVGMAALIISGYYWIILIIVGLLVVAILILLFLGPGFA
jgi:hypothetical protein